MAAASYATDLTLIDDCNTDTGYVEPTASGWTQLNAESFSETDLFIQNANSISATCKTGVGATLFNNTTGITIPTDGAFLVWMYWAAPNSLDTESNGGIRTIIGSSQANFDYVVHGGKDTYVYGGWLNLAMGAPSAITTTAVGTPSGTYQYFGWAYNAVTVPSKGNPYVVDAMRYGRCEIRAIDGDLSNGYADFTDMATKNDANDGTAGYNRWGLFQKVGGGFLWKGLMTLGTTTAVDFRDANKSINIDNTKHVTANFNKIEINHASSRVDWDGITFSALGTVSPGRLEVVDNADVNISLCIFNDMSTFIFQSASSVLDSTFTRCGQITHGGSTMNGSSISGYEGTADTSALIYNAAADPNGEMDNMSFTKGTAATHAIEFGTSSPLSITLTGIDFSGYNATNGQTDSTFHVKRTSGAETVTINISGGSGNVSYKTDGATVVVVQNPVALTVTCKDKDSQAVIEGAAVTIKAATGGVTGYFEQTVTITRVTTTATVAHTSHPYVVGNKVLIEGADQNDYNRIKTITAVTANSYDFTVANSPTTPATGTIKATAVLIDGLTNASGVISDTRTYSVDQPFTGTAKKGSSTPLYKSTPVTGTIDKDTGSPVTSLMTPD